VRADLSPAERAAHQAERKRLYEREHPETKHGGAPGKAGGGKKGSGESGQIGHSRYTAEVAKKTGTSERSVRREVSRGESIPDVGRLAGTSLDKAEQLEALAKLPKEDQQPLIERAIKGERVNAKTVEKQNKRDERERALAKDTAAAAEKIGTKLYGVIYADPPWRFEPYSRETGMDRAADNHYPTMLVEQIKGLEIPAADECVLFLWATAPMLPQALEVMAAWGFAYKTHCIWRKSKIGTGYWFRNSHELLLIWTRGSVPAPAPGTQPPSVIDDDTPQHSAKPIQFATMIEQWFPNMQRLEMFARKPRDRWDSWGNEIPAVCPQ
jgi:N6-adenosine-specific RNA methylase IME4